MIRHILISGALAISSPALRADDGAPPPVQATLGVGSKAPALEPEKWLKGEPVASFDPDKVYLVECWATWCGPCLAAIPHLNELHNRFKDQGLVIIGMNVMGDTEEKAAAFVARKGDKMAYRVAYDGKAGRTAKDWLQAAGVRGIPHSFLVRDGGILWHGHPSELTEANIREVLKGGAIASKPAAERDGPSEEVVAYRKARLEILGLLRNSEADKALALISENEVILTDTTQADPDVLRGMAYSVKGDREQSLAHYHKAIKAAGGDAVGLYRVVHGLLDHGSVRDPGLALKCAREAAAKDPNPVVRHMLARAETAAGNKAAATAILEQLAEEGHDNLDREEPRKLQGDRQVSPNGRPDE